MFEHIVAGCDGTDSGLDAAALAAAIAERTGDPLTLVGVFEPSLLPIAGVTDRKTLRTGTDRALRRTRDAVAPQAMISCRVDGSVAHGLRREAAHWHAGLLVVGSSRRAAPAHVHAGRHARQLLHDGPPAVAIASRDLHRRAVQLGVVGVGLDNGPESRAALELAARLAASSGGRLAVTRVIEERVPTFTEAEWMALPDWSPKAIWDPAVAGARRRAEALLASLPVPADLSVVLGDPGEELRRASTDVDLMVVGSRRWGTVARLFTGSVGETLVADAQAPIILVPRPDRHGRTVRGQAPARPAHTPIA